MGNSENAYERKIQLAGGTTYTVSLPKEWASDHGLEAGASVRVYPHTDGSLVVRTNGHQAVDSDPLSLPADDADAVALRRQVGAAYRTGRDAVALTSDAGFSTDQQAAIRAATQDLLGVDVVDVSDGRVVCKSLLDGSDVSVEQSLHQLQYAALSAHRDAMAALHGEGEGMATIKDRRSEATRLLALVTRQFERALLDPAALDDLAVTRSTLFDYDAVARELERVATHADTIATVAGGREAHLPAAATASLDPVASNAHELVERATSAVLDGSEADGACGLLADADALRTDALDSIDRSESLDATTLADRATVSHALAATVDAGRAIADVALRAAVRDDGR